MNDVSRRRRTAVVSIVAALAMGLSAYILFRPEKPLATSDSPDGRYRCLVLEQSAQPYVYTFSICDARTGNALAGRAHSLNNDSCPPKELARTPSSDDRYSCWVYHDSGLVKGTPNIYAVSVLSHRTWDNLRDPDL